MAIFCSLTPFVVTWSRKYGDNVTVTSVDDFGPGLDLYSDRSRWMQRHSGDLRFLSLRQLVLIDCHDCGTGVDSLQLVPDRLDWYHKKLYSVWKALDGCSRRLADIYARCVLRQVKTQTEDIYGQLMAGARSFDWRVFRTSEGHIGLSHVVLGEGVAHAIDSILRFLKEHPDELIFLWENALAGFDEATYEEYTFGMLIREFGDKLVPNSFGINTRYGELMETPHRIFYLTRPPNDSTEYGQLPVDDVHFSNPNIWPPGKVCGSGPGGDTVEKVRAHLDRELPKLSTDSSNLCHVGMTLELTGWDYAANVRQGRSFQRYCQPLTDDLGGMIRGWTVNAETVNALNFMSIYFLNEDPGAVGAAINACTRARPPQIPTRLLTDGKETAQLALRR
jgi:hypothetical protein